MGFMDKVKAQATVLADKAQTGVQQGQSKLQEMQSSKQEDHLLRELGAYVFLSERNRNQPDGEARVADIMSQIDALEAAGIVVTVAADPVPAPAAGAVPAVGIGRRCLPAGSPGRHRAPGRGTLPPDGAGAVPQQAGAIPQPGSAIPQPAAPSPGRKRHSPVGGRTPRPVDGSGAGHRSCTGLHRSRSWCGVLRRHPDCPRRVGRRPAMAPSM